MADIKSDKKTESLNALKNANKHLADLFTAMNNKDGTMSMAASELQYIARQCGELRVSVYESNQPQLILLKTRLELLAAKLNEAR